LTPRLPAGYPDQEEVLHPLEPLRIRVENQNLAGGEILFLVEDAPEGGFNARSADETIFTEASDMEALREAVRDAVRCHFLEGARPSLIRLHYVRSEVFAA
jgi:hypothetical protein